MYTQKFAVNSLFFFFNDTATTEIYTLSLHDALPISGRKSGRVQARLRGLQEHSGFWLVQILRRRFLHAESGSDRKSTRLNSSHMSISYAVFCLKKKKKQTSSAAYSKFQGRPHVTAR